MSGKVLILKFPPFQITVDHLIIDTNFQIFMIKIAPFFEWELGVQPLICGFGIVIYDYFYRAIQFLYNRKYSVCSCRNDSIGQ